MPIRARRIKKYLLLFLMIFLCLFSISSLIWGQKSPFSWNVNAQSNISCNGLSLTKSTITLGQTVSLIGRISGYGIIRYAKVNKIGDRLSTGTNPKTLAQGYNTIKTGFKPTEAGVYVFEVNVYDSSRCGQLCTAGKVLYKNTYVRGGSCDTSGHWQSIGSCSSNGCIKWLTVNTSSPSCPAKPSGLSTSVNSVSWEIRWPKDPNLPEGTSAYVKKTSGASSTTGICYSRWNAPLSGSVFRMYSKETFCNCDNVGFKAYYQKAGCPDVESDEVKINFGGCSCAKADLLHDNRISTADWEMFEGLYLEDGCANCTPWTCNWSKCGEADLNRDGIVNGDDGRFLDLCSGSTFCWCTYSPPPTPTPVSIKADGYTKDEGSNSGLSGAKILVHKVDTLNCSGNHSVCNPEYVASGSTGYWKSTCTDGPMKSILIEETANPTGYIDGTKDPTVPSGCTVWSKNKVCCKVDGKTSLGGIITFYNKK